MESLFDGAKMPCQNVCSFKQRVYARNMQDGICIVGSNTEHFLDHSAVPAITCM